MATQIHAFGPNGELSPGAEAALEGLGGGGGGGQSTVFYGSNASTARPTNPNPVIWIGHSGVVPTNATEDFDIIVTFDAPSEPDPEPPTAAPELALNVYSDTRIDGTITPLIDATGYEWAIETGTQTGDPTAIPTDIAGLVTFQATGLTAETTYTFWVRGYNGDGSGPWSAPQTATTSAAGALTYDLVTAAPASGNLWNDAAWDLFGAAGGVTMIASDDDGLYWYGNNSMSLITLNYAAAGDFGTDYDITVEYDDLGVNGQNGPLARCTATDNYYALFWKNDGNWALESCLNGDVSVLASGTVANPAGRKVIRLRVVGSSIQGWIDGILTVDLTDSTHTSGPPGLRTHRPAPMMGREYTVTKL